MGVVRETEAAGGGGGGVEKCMSYINNLRVSFIYCIVDNRIRLLSTGSRKKYPYI